MTERNRERFNSYLMGKKPDWKKKLHGFFFFWLSLLCFDIEVAYCITLGIIEKAKLRREREGERETLREIMLICHQCFFFLVLCWFGYEHTVWGTLIMCNVDHRLPCRLNLPPDLCKGWCLSQKRLSHKYKIYS